MNTEAPSAQPVEDSAQRSPSRDGAFSHRLPPEPAAAIRATRGLREALDHKTLDILKSACTTIALAYVVLIIFNSLTAPPTLARPMLLLDAVSLVIVSTLRIALGQRRVAVNWAQPVACAVLLGVFAHALLVAVLTGNDLYQGFLLLILAGMGFAVLSTRWLVLSISLVFIGGLPLILTSFSGSDLAQRLVVVAAAVAVCCLGHTSSRAESLRHLQSLQVAKSELAHQRELEAHQRSAKEQLGLSEARYRGLVEDQSEFVVCWLPDGTRTFVNDSYCRYLGVPGVEGSGGSYLSALTDEHRDELLLEVGSLTPQSPVMCERHLGSRSDGELRWQDWSHRGVFDNGGTLVEVRSVGRDVHGAKLAEETLLESETRYRGLFEASPDAIFVIDLEGIVLDANRTASEWLELPPDELAGRSIADIATPGLSSKLLETLLTPETGEAGQLEVPLLTANGEAIPVSLSCARFEDAERPALLLHARDLSRLRDAERQSRASEERLQRFFHASEDGVLFHTNGTILDANEILGALLGLRVPDLVGRQVIDFVASGERKEIQRLLESGRDATCPFTGLSTDGRRLVLEIISKTMLSDGNRIQVAVMRDIGERKRSEQVLRLSENKYQRLFEASRDAIFISSAAGRIEDVNPAALKLFGFNTRDEMLSRPAWDFYPDRRQRQKLLDQLAEDGFVEDFELNLKDRSGRDLVVLETATAERDESNQLVRYRGILRDVTRQRALEDTVRQTQKMEAVGRLAGGVAHDFNNLLTAIGGYTELCLGMTDESEPIHEDLNEILKAADRAAALTRQLLAFSRQQVLKPTVLDLSDLVRDFEKLLDRTLGEDIEVATRLEPAPWNVKADPGQIEQVLMNLAVNARDAMPEGGRLAIETGNVHLHGTEIPNCVFQPADYVVLSVADNGCGIDPETHEQLFEPFFTTKKEGRGTGLGLATVYGIVKQSGGYISIDSGPDKGTLAKVYLPRVDEQILQLETQQKLELEAMDSRTILVAEDNPIVLRLVTRVLKELGHVVVPAANPAEALRLAGRISGPLDLLLTDVVMPGMNGLELAKRVVAKRTETRVLFMSGYSKDVRFAPAALSAGDFLQKPFTRKALRQKVTAILGDTAESSRRRNAVA